jgi:single-strand DNA-binding protein
VDCAVGVEPLPPKTALFYTAEIFLPGGMMNNLNSILIEGNLVRDPLLRTTPKGTPICTFCLASNRYYKQDSGMEREVGFFDVETWARLAENCYTLGHKGRGVRVVGRLKQERWNGQDGKPRSRVTIVAEHVEFRPEIKREGEQGANSTENSDYGEELALAAEGYTQEAVVAAEAAEAVPDQYAPMRELEVAF